MRFLSPFLIFVALSIFLAIGLNLNPEQIKSPLIGKPMPSFAGLALIEPEQTIRHLDWVGTPGLVNIWASWCIACLDEHPLLMRLAELEQFPLHAINYKDEREDAIKWLINEGSPYQSIVHDLSGEIGIDWGVYGVPETYVLDARGIIQYKHIGPITPEDIDTVILPLIRKLQGQGSG